MAALTPRQRIVVGLLVAVLLGYEAYALFLKRSGETSYLPPSDRVQLSREIAGEVTLQQTFVMHADGLEWIELYARHSDLEPAGHVDLLLIGEGYATPVARARIPATTFVAGPYRWALPRVDRSAGRAYMLRIAVPDAANGHGLRFELGDPRYVQGELSIGGRSIWGDLKFGTHAARARLIDSLADVRRQGPPILSSDLVLVMGTILFNASLITILVGLFRTAPAS